MSAHILNNGNTTNGSNGYKTKSELNGNGTSNGGTSNGGSMNGSPPSFGFSTAYDKNGPESAWYSFESVEETANFLLERTEHRPKIGIICGSGLGGIGNRVENADVFPYENIPNFPISTVAGHSGKLIFGTINGVTVLCMQGRFHFYEGYPLTRCSMPVRVMKLMGVTHLIATNAAGGLNENYKVGDIMVVKDHINIMGFAGNNPLQGPNDPRFGLRFPPMNKAYDRELIKIAREIFKSMGREDEYQEGVYTCVGGPNYETVAELRTLRILGVDAIGMSTVHEVITAKHCDLTVFAFSLITNKCVTDYDNEESANHEEVMVTGQQRQIVVEEFLGRMLVRMQEKINSAGFD